VSFRLSQTAVLLASGGFLALFSAVALAQTADQPVQKNASDDRFIYEQVEEGILRLDSRTGEVSLCARQDSGWACRIVADERGALNVEIERLERENTELRKQVADRGLVTGSATAPVATPAPAPKVAAEAAPAEPKVAAAPEKPAEKQANARPATDAHLVVVHRTVEIADKIWRRLVEMMAAVKSDLRKNG
jgi:hypothetical protein